MLSIMYDFILDIVNTIWGIDKFLKIWEGIIDNGSKRFKRSTRKTDH
jgi:hypothetical protein